MTWVYSSCRHQHRHDDSPLLLFRCLLRLVPNNESHYGARLTQEPEEMSCPSMSSPNSSQKESAIMVNQMASALVRLTLQPTMALIYLNLVTLTLPSCGKVLSHPRWEAWKPHGMSLTHLGLPSLDYIPANSWGLFTLTSQLNSTNVVLLHQSLPLRGEKCSLTWLN